MNESGPISVSLGRQPVFDAKGKVWGYELLLVGSAELDSSGSLQQASVAITVQSSAYTCLQQMTETGRKIIVDFTEKSVLENLPYALPPVLAAVKVPEDIRTAPSAMESLTRLKADGYLIAIDGFSGSPACSDLYELADLICIDVSGLSRKDLSGIVAAAGMQGDQLLASRVEDQAQFKLCQELGFSYFHGPFFKKPDQITVRKLSSNEVLRFKLLELIEAEEPDFARLGDTIQADATISFRLLAYLNSAAFARNQKIKSVPQAITLLGWRNVKNWLRIVLLTDMNQSKIAHELVLLSAQRGMFLELVARDHDYWGFSPESLHLLGIFSLLDTLMGMPMAAIVVNLPIDNKMKAALCREPNNEYSPLLQLVQYLEEARWTDADRLIQDLNLDGKKVRAALQSSINWSSELESSHQIV